MKITNFFQIWIICAILLNTVLTQAVSSEQTIDVLKKELEIKFLKIYEDFEKITVSKQMRSSRLKKIDRYFINCLKNNQLFYSFIRTNSKGTVISEVIRGKLPERTFRKINTQRSFSIPATKKTPYKKLLRVKSGRYYLMWSAPVLVQQSGKGEVFSGVVITKIDLWDGCHEFSKITDRPFLISINRKTLYDHKWDDLENFTTKKLNLPGSKNLFIRAEKTIVAGEIPLDTAADLSAVTALNSESRKKASPRESSAVSTVKSAKKSAGKPSPTLFAKKKKETSSFPYTYIGIAAIVLGALVFGFMLLRQSKREKESIL